MWESQPRGRTFEASVTQHCFPLVSVRDASGSKLEEAWSAGIFLTNRKSRRRWSRQCSYWVWPPGTQALWVLPLHLSRWLSSSCLKAFKPKFQVGRKQKDEETFSLKGFELLSCKRSPITYHRTSPGWENLVFRFPDSLVGRAGD